MTEEIAFRPSQRKENTMNNKRMKDNRAVLCLLALFCLVTGLAPLADEGSGSRSALEAPVTRGQGIDSLPIDWSSGGPYGGHVNCLAINPNDADILFAGTEGGLYKSVDAGSNWTRTSFPSIAVRAIQVAEDQPDVVYAGTDVGVYRSANGGASWAQRGFAGEKIYALAIHPENSDVVYAGIKTWPYLPEEGEIVGVFKSTDGGQTWQPKHTGDDSVEALLIDTNDPSVIYAGVRNAYTGPGYFLKSIDNGETWDGVTPGPCGTGEPVYALAMTPKGHSPATLYAACYNNVDKSTNQGETWEPTDPPGVYMASAIAVDPNSPSTIYLVATYYASYEGAGFFYRSTDEGENWAVKTSGLAGNLPSSVIVDPRNSHVYVGFQTGGVFKSVNKADHWDLANEGLNSTYVKGLAVQGLSSKNAFAAVQGHLLSKSTDAGVTWSYLDQSIWNLRAVAVDPNNPSILWAGQDFQTASSFYVHKSTDGGLSWTSFKYLQTTSGTTTTGVSDILVNRNNSQCVLVGTTYRLLKNGISGNGVLARSLNGGQSWSKISGATTALAADPNDPDLVYKGKARSAQVFAISDVCGSAIVNEITPSGIGNVRDIEVGSGSEVFVATSDGLWRRDGLAWKKLSGLPTNDITAVAIDRSGEQDLLFAGTAEAGVYFSEDGGGTWAEINEGLGNLRVTELVIGIDSTRRLYAGTAYGGVWSTSLGETSGGGTGFSAYLPLLLKK
jgi:hypothetical protein